MVVYSNQSKLVGAIVYLSFRFTKMSSTELKKSIGKIVLRISNEVIELQKEYRKVKDGETLSRSGIELEKSVIEKRDSLVNALASLESKPDFIEEDNLQKTVKMIKDTINNFEVN